MSVVFYTRIFSFKSKSDALHFVKSSYLYIIIKWKKEKNEVILIKILYKWENIVGNRFSLRRKNKRKLEKIKLKKKKRSHKGKIDEETKQDEDYLKWRWDNQIKM